MNEYGSGGLQPAEHDLPVPEEFANNKLKHRAIVFMAFINVGEYLKICCFFDG